MDKEMASIAYYKRAKCILMQPHETQKGKVQGCSRS